MNYIRDRVGIKFQDIYERYFEMKTLHNVIFWEKDRATQVKQDEVKSLSTHCIIKWLCILSLYTLMYGIGCKINFRYWKLTLAQIKFWFCNCIGINHQEKKLTQIIKHPNMKSKGIAVCLIWNLEKIMWMTKEKR